MVLVSVPCEPLVPDRLHVTPALFESFETAAVIEIVCAWSMLFVPLGVNATPMDGGAEDELPQPDKPRVRKANNPDNNTAAVARFTIPPDVREFRISPDLVTRGIML